MKKIVEKNVHTLTNSEADQLAQLIRRYYVTAKEDFINNRVYLDHGYQIILLKEGEKVLGASFYHLCKTQTGLLNNSAYTLQFGQAMKQSGVRDNIIWTLGRWYATKHIGLTFPFRTVVGVSTIISPKVFENFVKLFPNAYGGQSTQEDPIVQAYLNNYFQQQRQMNIQVNKEFCYDFPDLQEEEEITKDWERVHKAKDETVNQLFFDKGILKQKNGKIYKTNRHLITCGIRQPISISRVKNWVMTPFINTNKKIRKVG